VDIPIPAIVSTLLLLAVATAFLLRDRARRSERRQELSRLGFRPSAEDNERLTDIVAAIENNQNYWYNVDDPMRSDAGDTPCYFYTKLRMQRTRVEAAEELLVSLKRPSKEGLLLVVETSALPFRSVRQWADALHPGVRRWYPRDLGPLEIPPGIEHCQIMGAFGPPGLALVDLIDIPTLDQIKEVGDLGVATISFRGDWCSFSAGSARTQLKVRALVALLS
jgi:hypothetical protein